MNARTHFTCAVTAMALGFVFMFGLASCAQQGPESSQTTQTSDEAPTDPPAAEQPPAKTEVNTSIVIRGDLSRVEVAEVVLSDGTRCVVLVPYSSNSPQLTCDWSHAK